MKRLVSAYTTHIAIGFDHLDCSGAHFEIKNMRLRLVAESKCRTNYLDQIGPSKELIVRMLLMNDVYIERSLRHTCYHNTVVQRRKTNRRVGLQVDLTPI